MMMTQCDNILDVCHWDTYFQVDVHFVHIVSLGIFCYATPHNFSPTRLIESSRFRDAMKMYNFLTSFQIQN